MLGRLFLPLKKLKCCIALSLKHPLSAKKLLTWADLSWESMLLVKRGSTPVLDAMRTEIESQNRVLTTFGISQQTALLSCFRQMVISYFFKLSAFLSP